jgi:hypothetical protein
MIKRGLNSTDQDGRDTGFTTDIARRAPVRAALVAGQPRQAVIRQCGFLAKQQRDIHEIPPVISRNGEMNLDW